ncbi:MAG TPA: 4Fe-4S dicluster domain-containing protein [Syntrophorhabdales bacterium]|nr:4Fe-4S dicluster domain-containing protein [Syntrophorhabdales bacterium]
MAKKTFVIDVKRCNGCHTCQVACKDEHVGNDWTPIAKPQPEVGQFWLKMEQEVRGTVPKVRVAYRPHLCMHCDEAPCMEACPVEGAIYKRKDGLVIIDPATCTGCRNCLGACPYDVIYFNEDLNIAQKCTGCAHLLDQGWKEPRCADACPTGVIRLMEEKEARPLVSHGEVWKPELKERVKPRLYYLNLPGRFIAGTLYDPREKEVIMGAACTLIDKEGRKVIETTTDDFGDFWFENLKEGEFSLEIRMSGKTKSFAALDTRGKDINLGDIPLV